MAGSVQILSVVYSVYCSPGCFNRLYVYFSGRFWEKRINSKKSILFWNISINYLWLLYFKRFNVFVCNSNMMLSFWEVV